MTDILDTALNEDDYHPDEIDEREILDDDYNGDNKKEEDQDLYDDAMAPSSVTNKRNDSTSEVPSVKANGATTTTVQPTKIDTSSKRYCCYVGNMTWWSTDADLQSLIQSCGADDLVDIKFYENRNNGQSKGYALAVFLSEASVKAVMEKLPTKELYGQHLVVLPYTKQSLAKFEEATKRAEQKDKKDDKSGMVNIGTFRIGTGGPTATNMPPIPGISLGIPRSTPPPNMVAAGIPGGLQGLLGAVQSAPPGVPVVNLTQRPMVATIQPIMQRPPVNLSAPPPSIPAASVNMSRPPPGFPSMSVAPPNMQAPPPTMRQQGAPSFPPGAHINPNVYPNFAQFGGEQLSEVEFEEIMNRNRTVSSSAISRAVSDAAAGDYASSIETLVTAISLIRQSRVAHDDRCKVLINSLQDTLHGIESKSYRKHRSGRDRSRSPSDRKRRRRSRTRSRSRSRDRYDYSPSPSRRRY